MNVERVTKFTLRGADVFPWLSPLIVISLASLRDAFSFILQEEGEDIAALFSSELEVEVAFASTHDVGDFASIFSSLSSGEEKEAITVGRILLGLRMFTLGSETALVAVCGDFEGCREVGLTEVTNSCCCLQGFSFCCFKTTGGSWSVDSGVPSSPGSKHTKVQ